MRFILTTKIVRFPKPISVREALDFYHYEREKHDVLMVMAAHWRIDPEPSEEDWFQELGPDELGDEDFLEEFATATLELWTRYYPH